MKPWETSETSGPSAREWFDKFQRDRCQCDTCQTMMKDAFTAGAFLMLRHLQTAAHKMGGDVGPFVDAQETAIAGLMADLARSAGGTAHH